MYIAETQYVPSFPIPSTPQGPQRSLIDMVDHKINGKTISDWHQLGTSLELGHANQIDKK
jgi:hypothetical protein